MGTNDHIEAVLRPGLQKWRAELRQSRAALENRLETLDRMIAAVDTLLDPEAAAAARHESEGGGEATGPVKWAGLPVTEAVRALLSEDPSLSRSEIADRLVKEGFDFGGKRPAQSVSLAYTHLVGGSPGARQRMDDGKPSVTRLLRRFLTEVPSFTPNEFRVYAARSIPNCPPKSITSAIKRARQTGAVESMGRGRWKSLQFRGAVTTAPGGQEVLPGALPSPNGANGESAVQITGLDALVHPTP